MGCILDGNGLGRIGMKEILVVDDERVLRESLKRDLEGEGYAVRTARDGEQALAMIAEKKPDLVLLDVMMPKMNGFRCCEEIRRTYDLLPVIFLTAKDTEADQVRGIGLGADDYISKDAGDALLFARIRRALARLEKIPAGFGDSSGRFVRLGGISVDVNNLGVIENGGEIGQLTKTEVGILVCLDANRGETVTFDDLITDLRGNGFACEDAMLYTHMSRLRSKLGKAGDMISSIRGVGYRLIT